MKITTNQHTQITMRVDITLEGDERIPVQGSKLPNRKEYREALITGVVFRFGYDVAAQRWTPGFSMASDITVLTAIERLKHGWSSPMNKSFYAFHRFPEESLQRLGKLRAQTMPTHKVIITHEEN